jgi:hypothetical protein
MPMTDPRGRRNRPAIKRRPYGQQMVIGKKPDRVRITIEDWPDNRRTRQKSLTVYGPTFEQVVQTIEEAMKSIVQIQP